MAKLVSGIFSINVKKKIVWSRVIYRYILFGYWTGSLDTN